MSIFETKVSRDIDGRLVTNIPFQVKPRIRISVRKPVREKLSEYKIMFNTGRLQNDGRIRIITPYEVLQREGFDPWQKILLDIGVNEWLQSHFYHGVPSGGVWIPKRIVDQYNMKSYVPVYGYVYGLTLPPTVPEELHEIVINHLHNSYLVYERKWYIPDVTIVIKNVSVVPDDLFGRHLNNVRAVWFYDENIVGIVEVEFLVYPGYPEQERTVAYENNLAFRTMGVKNYVISTEYLAQSGKVLEESRSTYLSAYPRNRYFEVRPKELTDILGITSRNMGAGLFFAKKWNKNGEMVIGNKLIEVGETQETIGGEWNRPIDYAKAQDGLFQQADKYARLRKTKKGKYTQWIALNKDVEELMDADKKGFIWRKTRNVQKR